MKKTFSTDLPAKKMFPSHHLEVHALKTLFSAGTSPTQKKYLPVDGKSPPDLQWQQLKYGEPLKHSIGSTGLPEFQLLLEH